MEAVVGPNVDCSRKRAAAAAVTPLLPDPTCTCKVFEVGDPTPGLMTCKATVPDEVDVPLALRLVDEMNVVGNITPPKITWAPLRKLLPLTDTVKLPTGIGVGRAAVTTGRALSRVTEDGALLDWGSWTLGALIVRVVEPGVKTAGAVYRPLALMVPTTVLPPEAPLTFHTTF